MSQLVYYFNVFPNFCLKISYKYLFITFILKSFIKKLILTHLIGISSNSITSKIQTNIYIYIYIYIYILKKCFSVTEI